MEKEAESETIRAQAGSEIQTETDKKLAIIAEQVEANKPQVSNFGLFSVRRF